MNIHLARSLAAALSDDQCIFGYSGRFPDEHSARLIELGEAAHCISETALSSKGRLGYVLVEAYQNIVRHRVAPTDETAWDKGRSMFLLRCRAQGHIMITRNPVTGAQQQKLEERLTELQGKNMNELKELFMEGIQRPNPPGTRGAGLGLIEMVRRAGAKPAWRFDRLDQTHFLFNLALELGDPGSAAVAPLADVGRLPELVLEHKIFCFYAGFWNPEVQKALIGMVQEERSPGTSDRAARSGMAGELADMLYSIIGAGGTMIFFLQGGDHPILSMGGEMDQAQLERLNTHAQGTDVRISTGTGKREGSVLAMAHITW